MVASHEALLPNCSPVHFVSRLAACVAPLSPQRSPHRIVWRIGSGRSGLRSTVANWVKHFASDAPFEDRQRTHQECPVFSVRLLSQADGQILPAVGFQSRIVREIRHRHGVPQRASTATMPMRSLCAAGCSTCCKRPSKSINCSSISLPGFSGRSLNAIRAAVGACSPWASTCFRSASLNLAKKSRPKLSRYSP